VSGELAKREGLSISIITKSNQIVRDIDVLTKIAARSSLQIDITVTTMRRAGAIAGATRAAAGPANRGGEGIARSGIGCRVSASPLVRDYGWRRRARSSRGRSEKAGAQWFFSGVLF